MSRELADAIDHLAAVLRRYFVTTGDPPQSAFWSYRAKDLECADERFNETLRAKFFEARKPENNKLSALIADNPHPLIVDAIRFIKPVSETAGALRNVRYWLEHEKSDSAAARCCHLFDKLCSTKWFKPKSVRLNILSPSAGRMWGYRLTVIKDQFLCDLVDAAHNTIVENKFAQRGQPPHGPRLVVSIEDSQAILDEKPYKVEPKAAAFLNVLIQANGDWVAGPSLKLNFALTKPDRIKKALPPPIRDLIESARSKGYRLQRSILA